MGKSKASGRFSEDLLETYALNRLREPQRVQLEEHLLVCEACRSGLSEIEVYISVVKAATTEAPTETPVVGVGSAVGR